MSNNHMSLVNTATGQRVLLATRLATKWGALAGIEDKLDHAFATELAEFSAACGSTAWRIEYETNEPELDANLTKRSLRSSSDPSAEDKSWFYAPLQAYAAFCRLVPNDVTRTAIAAAIDASLVAWRRGAEPSAVHRARIEAEVMRGDAVIAPALVALFAQIEVGGEPAVRNGARPPSDRLDRLQRRILEIWASEFPSMANEFSAASEGRALAADTLDLLEAFAIGSGPRGTALRQALKVCATSRTLSSGSCDSEIVSGASCG